MRDFVQRQRGNNKTLALAYFITDFMYGVNLICQVLILNSVLNNRFLRYGIDQNLDTVFPKISECTFSDVDNKQIRAICVLPKNYLSDKFVLFLWYYLLVLGFITLYMLLFHLLFIVKREFRIKILCLKAGKYCQSHHIRRL